MALSSGIIIAASVLVSVVPLNVPKPTCIPPLALILPSTCNFSVDSVVPIPTLPALSIRNLSTLPLVNNLKLPLVPE